MHRVSFAPGQHSALILVGARRWLEYGHNYIVSPILQLFHQLRLPEVKDDMFSHAEQDEDGEFCSVSIYVLLVTLT
jgi:hypothetical protein